MKKLTIFFLMLCSFVLNTTAFAAPEILSSDIETRSRVVITGQLASVSAGVKYPVTVMLLDSGADDASPSAEDILYMNETYAQADGSYKFDFYTTALSYDENGYSEQKVYMSLNGENISQSIKKATVLSEQLRASVKFGYTESDSVIRTITEIHNTFNKEGLESTTLVAFYKAGVLVGVQPYLNALNGTDSERFEREVHIPEGADEAKLFMWQSVDSPLSLCTPARLDLSDRQVIILKMDDLQFNKSSVDAFQKLVDYADAWGVKLGIGAIGLSFGNVDMTNEANIALANQIKGWINNGHEIWHHGYYHATINDKREYDGFDYDASCASIEATINGLKNVLDYDVVSFGAPYNSANDTTVSALLASFPKLQAAMYMWKSGNRLTEAGVQVLNSIAYIEAGTGIVSYDRFIESYDPEADYYVLQGHGGAWDEDSYREFDKIMDVLIANNVVFMTPCEYADYLNAIE